MTIQEYTTGSGDWTVPAGVYLVDVLLVGGGGGGGGAKKTGAIDAGAGAGGGGGIGVITGIAVTPGAVIPYAVGAAGTAGANTPTDGGNGGNTTFGGLIVGGGVKGTKATDTEAAGGAGGVCYAQTGGAGGTAGGGAGGVGVYGAYGSSFLGEHSGAGGGGGTKVGNGGAGGTTQYVLAGAIGGVGIGSGGGGGSSYKIGGVGGRGVAGTAAAANSGGGGGAGGVYDIGTAVAGGAGGTGYIRIMWDEAGGAGGDATAANQTIIINDLAATHIHAAGSETQATAAAASLANGGFTDLLIDGIAAKTVNLPASPAAVGSAMTLAADQAVNVTKISGAAVNTATAQVGCNVVSQANIDFGATQKASITTAATASTPTVTLANGAHGGAATVVTLQTPIVANTTLIEGGDATDAIAAASAGALDAANTELAAVPTTTGSLRTMIQWLFQGDRNKKTVTATEEKRYKEDASTVLSTKTLSEDGTTYTQSEPV